MKKIEEYKINEQYLGMLALFRGCIIIDWEGTNFKSIKYRKLNKIIAQKCIEYYNKYWKHRNNEYYNEEK